VGVDGEGVTLDDGTHRYILLSVGDQSLYRGGEDLRWYDQFSFLYDCFLERPNAAYVGFFLGYDFTHWIKSLSEDRAKMLLTVEGRASRQRNRSGGNNIPFPVVARDVYGIEWEFDMLDKKRFKLRPVRKDAKWMYICDAGPFYQTSFINAIDPTRSTVPVCTDEEFAIIVEGKSRRSTAEYGTDMIRYNITENAVLAKAMTQLNRGYVEMGVRLKKDQWFGPGQAATQWLNNINAPTTAEITDVTPTDVLSAARATYYGGWFEIFMHGPIPGTVHEYDLNSAYPAIIATLPCLLHGQWTKKESASRYTMYDVTVAAPETLSNGQRALVGPLPHRVPNGKILRPLATRGWYWKEEILAASELYGNDMTIEIHDTWTYEPCACPPPFASIAELYEQRKRVGKNTPAGIALKLVYNSAYGKFAQSVGAPKHASSIYASLITSGTRTSLMRAIASHPNGMNSVTMCATDGVYFREPHPNLDIDPERLGAWDASVKTNMTQLQPGVYWDDKSRRSVGSDRVIIKSRGVSAHDLSIWINDIDAMFAASDSEWPTFEIPIRFQMTSAKLAMARGKWHTAGHVETGGMRSQTSDPFEKRQYIGVVDGVRRSAPYATGACLESRPYDRMFGETDSGVMSDNDLLMTEDGPATTLIIDMLTRDGIG
jgi:hypothetical protein